MTPTEAEVEAFARKLAAEAGWERYVDTARRTLEAAPTDASMTDTLPAEAIEAAAEALYIIDHDGEYGPFRALDELFRDTYRDYARAALLAALPHIRGAASPSPTSVPDGQEAVATDFMSLAAHLAKINNGRSVLEREADGVVFVSRDVCIEAMQSLLAASPIPVEHPAPSDREGIVEARIYIDCEFNGWMGELLSFAMVAEDGREFYSVLPEPPTWDEWCFENVFPVLNKQPVASYADFRLAFLEFLRGFCNPVIVADWPADLYYFTKVLLGNGHEESVLIPCRMELAACDYRSAVPHNALEDARAIAALRKMGAGR